MLDPKSNWVARTGATTISARRGRVRRDGDGIRACAGSSEHGRDVRGHGRHVQPAHERVPRLYIAADDSYHLVLLRLVPARRLARVQQVEDARKQHVQAAPT